MGNIGSNGWFLTLLCSSDVLWCLQRIRLDVDVITSIHFFFGFSKHFHRVFIPCFFWPPQGSSWRWHAPFWRPLLWMTTSKIAFPEERARVFLCWQPYSPVASLQMWGSSFSVCLAKNVGENLDMHVDSNFPATRYRCICHPFLWFLLRKKTLHYGIVSIPSKTPGAETSLLSGG